MSILISAPAVQPAWQTPYPYSALSVFRSQRPLDPHAWFPISNHGGIEWVPEPCVLNAFSYDPLLCDAGALKSSPQYIQRPSVTTEARWFESAAARSTMPGCSSLEEAVTKALEAEVRTAVDTEIAATLQAGVVVLGSKPSVLCAVSAAVSTLAGVNGDGHGVITLPPDAVAALSFGDYFESSSGDRLTDTFGNLYVVNPSSVAGRIYVEHQAAYEIFVSDPDFTNESDLHLEHDSVTLKTNTEILRGSQGYILAHSHCGTVSAWDYECGA